MDTCSSGIRSRSAFTSEVLPAPDGAAMTKSLPRRADGGWTGIWVIPESGEGSRGGRYYQPEFHRQRPQRLSPMTDLVLLLRGQLRCGVVHSGGNKDRVITEAARAAGFGGDLAFPGTVSHDRVAIVGVADKHHDAVVARLAEFGRYVVQLCQQFAQVVVIAGVLAGEARGVHAGAAIQGI